MFFPESMKSSRDKRFGVRDQNVGPFEYFMGLFTFNDFLYVIMSTFANNSIDRQTIGLNRLIYSNIRFYEVVNGCTVYFIYHSHFGKANGIAMGRCFNNYSCFRSTTTALTTFLCGTTKERVIDLNNPSQLIGRITILHC